MQSKSARIADVARVAGVSTATVSRALSKPELLTQRTRDVVFEAIRTTGYRVNRTARNLRTQRAGAVLVLVPNLGNPFFSQILAGLNGAFADSEYSVLISDTVASPLHEMQLVDYFVESSIDGVISLDGSLSSESLAALDRNGVAERIVFACEWVDGVAAPSVRSDNAEGARLAVRHLYDLGHRRIAHVTGPTHNVLTRVRRDAMQDERARLALPTRSEWIIRGDFSLRSGHDAAAQLLQLSERPTAVFCASDMMAFGLISALTAAGVSVPRDISVVGFDDIEMSAYYSPALTTVRQDRQALGMCAARLLLNQLEGKPERIETEILTVALQARESTAPPSS